MGAVVKLTAPQSEFFSSTAEYTAAVAGFGSGKTQAALTRIIANKLTYPGIDQAYLAPTYSLISDIFYPKVADLLHSVGKQFRINRSSHTIFIDGYGKIICRTMDNPDSIVGWEVGDAFLDEFDVIETEKAKRVMQKASARCRQKYPDGKKNQKWVTTTPEGFKATYELFKRNPIPDSKLVQMSTYSNQENLPKGYIEGLLAQYPEQLIKAYLNGEFVNLTSGSVYSYFDRRRHHINARILPKEPLHIGQDFNYGGCVSSVFVIRDNIPLLLDGFVSTDTAGIVENIRHRFKDHFVTIYPDSSGNHSSSNATLTDIQILQRAGIKVDCPSKNPYIRDRVNCVNRLFDKDMFFINCDMVPEHVEALEKQAWDQKTGLPEKSSMPGSVDDYNDSIGYFIHRRFPIERANFGVQFNL